MAYWAGWIDFEHVIDEPLLLSVKLELFVLARRYKVLICRNIAGTNNLIRRGSAVMPQGKNTANAMIPQSYAPACGNSIPPFFLRMAGVIIFKTPDKFRHYYHPRESIELN